MAMKTVQISESCWRQLKVQAAEEGRTLVSLVEAGVELYLESTTRATEDEPDDEPAWTGPVPPDALCVCGHQAGHHHGWTGRCQRRGCFPMGCLAFHGATAPGG